MQTNELRTLHTTAKRHTLNLKFYFRTTVHCDYIRNAPVSIAPKKKHIFYPNLGKTHLILHFP